MKVLRYLIEKEFKQIKRSGFVPRLIVMMPLMAIIVFPFAANFEVKDIKVDIVDHDHSDLTHELTQKIAASTSFLLAASSSDYDSAIRNIERDVADIVIEFPGGFEADLIRDQEATVLISANAVNGKQRWTRLSLSAIYFTGL